MRKHDVRETDGDGSYHFHYDREERESGLSPATKERLDTSRSKGIFRKNRGLIIVLLDIILIALIFGAFTFVYPVFRQNSVPGYSVKINAFQFEEQVLISIKLKKTKDLERIAETCSISIRDDVETVLLPSEVGEELVVRKSIPINEEETVTVILEVGGNSYSFKTGIKLE